MSVSRYIFLACGCPVVAAPFVEKTLHVLLLLLLCHRSVDCVHGGLFLHSRFCSIDLRVDSFTSVTLS